MGRDWELNAVCRTLDPDIFFRSSEKAAAKAACGRCPVRAECLEAVMASEEGLSATYRDGIFAELEPGERAALAEGRGEAKRPVKRTRGQGRKQAECGTRSAYQRHQRKGEPIDQACKDAHALGNREYRRTGSTQVPTAR
ncbi:MULTISPECIES: WhiB family transcriptional regulator [unclassified Streptomyces]|uniref:WhiB family transcriptional regulator n=1 Tax=unclassified Streptomyces TaxID=2593676 RepID=UPI00190DA3C7|nr:MULTISPECIES: WhiB family transcriptional regulator [unclassified Streptomyces]MBK3563190.1 WhiB family transcriptional regulator [Streptomyces sp. MBT62]MBK6013179.1 WhiB family transcriptional regulator [Streptomyces sp. MBT53]